MLERLHSWAFTGHKPDNRIRELARILVRILLILVHVTVKTGLLLRASALTYSIILSLVPMLAMSTAILKGLGSDNDLKIAAFRLLDQLAPPAGTDEPGTASLDPSPEHPSPRQEKESGNVVQHLRNGVTMIFDYVDRTNFAAIGTFGIIGLLVMVLMMLNSIETTMNVIWHSDKNRPWGRKIMNYLALLVLLPVSLNAAFAGNAILQSERIMTTLRTVIGSEWLIKMLFKELPFVCIVLSLTLMYRFFPYARVRTLPALTGAMFASWAWLSTLQIYIHLQIGVARYNAIYGSFATVPLFLVWMHLGWLFLLLGAALAYAIQNRNSYLPAFNDHRTPARRLQAAFDLLCALYDDFDAGRPSTPETLKQRLQTENEAMIRELAVILCREGLVRKLDNEGEDMRLVPAWPRDRFPMSRLIDLFLGHPEDTTTQKGSFAGAIVDAARDAVSRISLIRSAVKESYDERT